MTFRTMYLAILAGAMVLGAGLLAQAPTPPAPPAGPPPTAAAPAPPQVPTGIQTLPISPKDLVKPEEVVLTIGNEKITKVQFETIKAGLPPQYAGVPQQMGDKGFAGAYAQFRGLAIEGERQKLDQTREFREQLNFLRTELLARLAVTALSAKSQEVSDQEIKAYFDSHTAELQQAKVKGIFVALNPPAKPAAPAAGGAAVKAEAPKARTDEEAKARAEELRKQILAGADFATVARENSEHQASAEKGGDLGTLRKGSLPPNLDKTVFALKPKEVSEPVKEGQGYYIFQVDEIPGGHLGRGHRHHPQHPSAAEDDHRSGEGQNGLPGGVQRQVLQRGARAAGRAGAPGDHGGSPGPARRPASPRRRPHRRLRPPRPRPRPQKNRRRSRLAVVGGNSRQPIAVSLDFLAQRRHGFKLCI